MRVVERGAEDLSAGKVLERSRDPPPHRHTRRVEGPRGAEAGQRRAIRAQQEDGLYEIAASLLDGERRQLAVVERALGHHAIHRETELLLDLDQRELGHGGVAATV